MNRNKAKQRNIEVGRETLGNKEDDGGKKGIRQGGRGKYDLNVINVYEIIQG